MDQCICEAHATHIGHKLKLIIMKFIHSHKQYIPHIKSCIYTQSRQFPCKHVLYKSPMYHMGTCISCHYTGNLIYRYIFIKGNTYQTLRGAIDSQANT